MPCVLENPWWTKKHRKSQIFPGIAWFGYTHTHLSGKTSFVVVTFRMRIWLKALMVWNHWPWNWMKKASCDPGEGGDGEELHIDGVIGWTNPSYGKWLGNPMTLFVCSWGRVGKGFWMKSVLGDGGMMFGKMCLKLKSAVWGKEGGSLCDVRWYAYDLFTRNVRKHVTYIFIFIHIHIFLDHLLRDNHYTMKFVMWSDKEVTCDDKISSCSRVEIWDVIQ